MWIERLVLRPTDVSMSKDSEDTTSYFRLVNLRARGHRHGCQITTWVQPCIYDFKMVRKGTAERIVRSNIEDRMRRNGRACCSLEAALR